MQLYPYILLPLFLSSCLQTDPKVSGDVPVSVRSVNYNADRALPSAFTMSVVKTIRKSRRIRTTPSIWTVIILLAVTI